MFLKKRSCYCAVEYGQTLEFQVSFLGNCLTSSQATLLILSGLSVLCLNSFLNLSLHVREKNR